MDILGTLKNLQKVANGVDEAMKLKEAVERLQTTVSVLLTQLNELQKLLKAVKHD